AQMAKTAEARRRHAAAGLAHVTVLTSPTTGGVYASFASLADVVIASPDATVGFAGPRVVEELTGARPDPRIHKVEFAFEHGLIDAVVPVAQQSSVIGNVLGSINARGDAATANEPAIARSETRPQTAWERLELARDP